MNKYTMIIPNDFDGKIIEKSWFDKGLTTVIYFDENKWDFEQIQNWYDLISNFTQCPTMMLPKSFSELQYLEHDEMLMLKNVVDRAVEKMNSNQDN